MGFMKKELTILAGMLAAVTISACGGTNNNNNNNTEASTASSNESSVVITSFIDGKDVEIEYDKIPERVVSGASCTTEMLLSLGLADRIAGYYYLDNLVPEEYRDEFSKLTELSKESPSREELLAVKPDFFTGWVADMEDGAFDMKFCEENGIKQYAPRVDAQTATVDTVYQDLENFGKIFHEEERANELISEMKEEISETEKKLEGADDVKVFLYDSDGSQPLTVGSGLASDLIDLAGGKNIFADDFEYWANVNVETIVDRNPEYILIVDYFVSGPVEDKVEFIKNNEALKDVDAVKNDRIKVIDFADVTGGIRNADIVEEMAEFFHPEVF